MPDLIKVGMADYKVGAAPSTLISYGLGSCIGLSLYDPKAQVGGLLHYMLPDSKQARPSDTLQNSLTPVFRSCLRMS